MAGCNCKNGQTVDSFFENQNETKIPIIKLIVKYILKIIGFMLLLLLLPIINLYIIWLMFNMLVLNKNIDVKPLLLSIASKFKQKYEDSDDEDDEDYEMLSEEDVILLDVEDITNK